MQSNTMRMQAIQTLDQRVATFRKDYLSMNEADRRALRLRLANRAAAKPVDRVSHSSSIYVVTHEDGSVRTVLLDPAVLLKAIDAWDAGGCFAPSPEEIFGDSPIG